MTYNTLDYLPDLTFSQIAFSNSLIFEPTSPTAIPLDNVALGFRSEAYNLFGYSAIYEFQAKEGATYKIMSWGPSDPSLLLYDKSGNAIKKNSESDDATNLALSSDDIIGWVAPYTGKYYIDAGWNDYSVSSGMLLVYEDIDTINHVSVTSSEKYTLEAGKRELILTGIKAISGKGNDGDNVITGNSAANTLDGWRGDDALYGDEGNDKLLGGAGDDYLNGGVGSDKLTGGVGSDVFVFDELDYNSSLTKVTVDTVTDFKHSEGDKIDLSSLGDVSIFKKLNDAKNADAGENLIYESSTGKIYYDEDGVSPGNSSEPAILIGIITGKPLLVDADFI